LLSARKQNSQNKHKTNAMENGKCRRPPGKPTVCCSRKNATGRQYLLKKKHGVFCSRKNRAVFC
ncbi:hypothetical protein, partial [Xaviernesmea oryzae]|uniref:hypothetical protein n=1 Tax=Xaviernesmea oryzae TaxID=464029 RepID=UPI001AECC96F